MATPTDTTTTASKALAGQINSILSIVTTVGLPTVISIFFVFFYIPQHDQLRDKMMAEMSKSVEAQTKNFEILNEVCTNGLRQIREKLDTARNSQNYKKKTQPSPNETIDDPVGTDISSRGRMMPKIKTLGRSL